MSLLSIIAVGAPLRQTLAECVPVLQRHCRDPWVVIGSAATWLAGGIVPVGDLDLLTSTRDADLLATHWQARLVATDSVVDADRFRSRFARLAFPAMAVELMGDLEVCGGGRWTPVKIDPVVTARIDGLAISIPSMAEQIRLLTLFGRPKDTQRLDYLHRMLEASS